MKERLSWFQRVFFGRHVLSHPEKNWNNKAEEQIGRVCLSFVSYISGVEYIKVFQKENTKISYVKVNMTVSVFQYSWLKMSVLLHF